MTLSPYDGPSVFGFETDALRRVAAISVHTSPLAALGGRDAGGMNVYIRELACHTSQLGIPVDVFTRRVDPEAPETIQICDDVTLVNITAGPVAPIDKNSVFPFLPEFAQQMALYGLRNGFRYDVVHAHYWLSGWVAHLLKRYWETPFVQMFHTTAHMKNAVSSAVHQETALRSKIERELVGLANSVVAANPDERADLVWRQHAPSDKTCTIPPGVDTALFKPLDRAESRRILDLDPDPKIVLFVGRIDPIKGIDVLLDAAAQFADDPDAPSSSSWAAISTRTGSRLGRSPTSRRQPTARGVASNCLFVGSQPQDQLPRFYSAADVVAVPSRYESFGLVAVEAMACGRPVVASCAGGLTFTIDDGETGILVSVGDPAALAAALRRLLDSDSLSTLMGTMGHFAAQRFSWEAVASSVVHLYHRLALGQSAKVCCEEEIFA